MIGRPVADPRTGRPGLGMSDGGLTRGGLRFYFRSDTVSASDFEAKGSHMTVAAPRLAPLDPPYEPETARTLERMMPPGLPPLTLFRTVAHNPAILERFRSTGAYLLNFGTLPALDREIVIQRTCARCGCEYEWGVHAVFYGERVGLSADQLDATTAPDGAVGGPAWSDEQRLLIALVDALHDRADVDDALWERLSACYSEAQLVELVALVGQYHLVSFIANAFRVELEDSAGRFPPHG
jgi:4-carboxymuconolactone decarboxylase